MQRTKPESPFSMHATTIRKHVWRLHSQKTCRRNRDVYRIDRSRVMTLLSIHEETIARMHSNRNQHERGLHQPRFVCTPAMGYGIAALASGW